MSESSALRLSSELSFKSYLKSYINVSVINQTHRMAMATVKMDWKECNGCATCVGGCPADIYEMQYLDDYPDSLKSVPVGESDRTLCISCVTACPVQAIEVHE